jgi:hypothetical protein
MAVEQRTQFTMKAIGLADFFRSALGDRRVSGHKVELAAPDGPSTGGGKQALQHISLIPDAGGATITAGSANVADRIAEIRTWEHLKQLHARRFGRRAFPLDRVSYNELIKRMQAFFAEQKLTVVLVDAAALPAERFRATTVALGLAVAAATAGAVYYLLSLQRG